MGALTRPLRGTPQPVRVFPDPILKTVCRPVRGDEPAAFQLAEDLIETMLSLPRCVGLAAPQIGADLRIIVVDVSRNTRVRGKNHGLLCMINPELRLLFGEVVTREGCASVPELTANVRRAERVAVTYLDVLGIERCLETRGFEAVAIQHEIDHLDGKLFVDRVGPGDLFRRQRIADK